MLFKKRPLIEPLSAQWQLETSAWILRQTGGITRFRNTPLVLPTDYFFPERGLRGAEGIRVLFDRVRYWAGMSEWPCELRPQDAEDEQPMSDALILEHHARYAAGTFSMAPGHDSTPVITYDVRLSRDPMGLVATFAHELAHYLSSTFPEGPPGGEDMHEPATDMTAVFMGFGVFLANSAFHFQQYSGGGRSGWRAETQGYLPEVELLNAMAIFCSLSGAPWREALPHLDAHLRPLLKRAVKELDGQPALLAPLRADS